jgi:hypothetical protein
MKYRPSYLDIKLDVKRGKVKRLKSFYKVGKIWYSLKTGKKEKGK